MKILEYITEKRNGHYCHALEIDSVYSLETIIESLIEELCNRFTLEDYIEFFQSIELYYYTEDEENKQDEENLYNVNMKELVTNIYNDIL